MYPHYKPIQTICAIRVYFAIFFIPSEASKITRLPTDFHDVEQPLRRNSTPPLVYNHSQAHLKLTICTRMRVFAAVSNAVVRFVATTVAYLTITQRPIHPCRSRKNSNYLQAGFLRPIKTKLLTLCNRIASCRLDIEFTISLNFMRTLVFDKLLLFYHWERQNCNWYSPYRNGPKTMGRPLASIEEHHSSGNGTVVLRIQGNHV